MHNLITKATVAAKLGYHPGHVMRLVREGKFPKPIKLGHGEAGAVRLVESEIDNWLDAKLAERSPA